MQIGMQLRSGLPPAALRAARATEESTRTFLCSDVVSFSRLTEEMGDQRTLELMRDVARLIHRQCAAQGGRELEIRGDCFLLAFASPLAALSCGVAVHRLLAADRHAPPREQVALRSAIHVGCVVCDGDRYFGRNLILAFRLLERAGRGEILISSSVRNLIERDWRGYFSHEQVFRPKGLSEELGFVSVDWVENDLGRPASPTRNASRPAAPSQGDPHCAREA
jgi:class 3 adenylate cyclase